MIYRIVIVDDHEDIREMVRLQLSLSGPEFDVIGEAGDGQEAVVVVGRLQPDVVLLDLSMPVMDGLEALPLIKQRARQAKVLIHSAFSEPNLQDAALTAGADGYLVKDGSRAGLIEAIRGL